MTQPTALLVSADDLLLDDVLRLAAAAGADLDVAHDIDAAVRAWPTAQVVLVGADLADRLAAQRPPRREGVQVLGHRPTGDGLFRAALHVGAENVAELPASETWLVELLTDAADGGAHPATSIAVVGGSGGCGATTFAAALAATAAKNASCVLVDADPLGGGIDRVAGMDELDGLRWDSLGQTAGRLSSRSLRDALPRRGGLAVLTWAAGDQRRLEPFAVREVLSAAQRGNDFVVVDLPRYPDAVTAEVLTRCEHTVLVSGLTVPAVASASRVVDRLRDSACHIHLVTRGGAAGAVPEDVARLFAVPLAAAMADQRRLAESVDLGLGPVRSPRGPLARAAREVLARLDGIVGRAA